MDLREILGLLGGVCTNLGFVPQIVRLFKLKSAYELSLSFIILFLSGVSFWLAYGISMGLPSIIFWNVISIVFGGLMLFAKLKYGRVKKL